MKNKKNMVNKIGLFVALIVIVTSLHVESVLAYTENADTMMALEEDPYEGVTKISLKNMFDQKEDDYYVYFYMVQCPFCNQVKDGMLHFAAENNNVYFVDYSVKENRPLQKYNWAATRSKYNKKIGYIDEDGNRVFLYGESEEKYKNMKNDYGKLMRFNFVTITQNDLSSFPGSNVGDIYRYPDTRN